ncbi:MAG: M61 family metallopeptidase, partial [Chitinophagaceae bacterium]|nr:M61 family metallopeptidase [Rubrivivax sp.]
APAAAAAPLSAAAYPGTVLLRVDATDLDHKVLRVQQTLPVRAGPLRLFFPRWLPGTHSPSGDVALLAGLKINARGQPLAWQRDPLDTHAFGIDVPAGTTTLDIEFQYLSPLAREAGRVVVTRQMANLQWNNLLLYPAGYAARQITVQATLLLPAGWSPGTALRPDAQSQRPDGTSVQYKPVTLETLIDSPVFAGRHLRRVELDPPGAARPVSLTIVADRPDMLAKASEAQLEAHRELVRQSDRLFGARHFAKYDFLLALSDDLSGIGLEHHESSENGVRPSYFDDWTRRIGARELLPHEYVHSWNGKFRRPLDMATPHFNVPMQNTLVWLYEGQTEFWGWVLAARSGLTTADLARDRLANIAADYARRTGRSWRNLQDTSNDPIMSRGRSKEWLDWQRSGGDYYLESVLIWLDADTLIREKSGGARSMDDFARSFFGLPAGAREGDLGPLPYRFDDLVAALNAVQPHDWAALLRARLDSNNTGGVVDGLARSGWNLAFADTPSEFLRANEGENRQTDLRHSLGVQVGFDGKLNSVAWGGPAFEAGVSSNASVLAVNQRAYKPELLKEAITANRSGAAPIELLLREGDLFRSVRIDYRGGLRYPRLERLAGVEDRLSKLLAPRP